MGRVSGRWIQINLTVSPLVWRQGLWDIGQRQLQEQSPPTILSIGKQKKLVYIKGTLFYSAQGCKTLMKTDMNLSSWFSWGLVLWRDVYVCLFGRGVLLFLDVFQMAPWLRWIAEELMMCLRINCGICPECKNCMLHYRTWPLRKYSICYSCQLTCLLFQ